MTRAFVVGTMVLCAVGCASPAEVARRETIKRVIEEDEARRVAYSMAETMRCGQMDILRPGAAPARPVRVVESIALEAPGLREAEESFRKEACDRGADIVLEMRQEDEAPSNSRDVRVAINPNGVKVRTPNRNVSVGLGPEQRRYVATLAAFTDGSSVPRGTISIDLVGRAASPSKAQRCIHAINAIGSRVSASAPVRAVLHLEEDENIQLQVITAQGVILDEPRPDWRVERLCQNAAVSALQAYTRGPK